MMNNKQRIYYYFFTLLFIVNAAGCFSAEKHNQPSKRIRLINTALHYLGTPYRYTGTTAKGMDCSGLVYRSILETFKKKMPRRSDALEAATQKIRDEDIQPGDLLFFKTTKRISHVAIYIGAGQFIHSASDGPRKGVIISRLSEAYWRKTYVLAGRITPEEAIFSTEAVGTHIMLRSEENCSLHPEITLSKE